MDYKVRYQSISQSVSRSFGVYFRCRRYGLIYIARPVRCNILTRCLYELHKRREYGAVHAKYGLKVVINALKGKLKKGI